MAFRVKRDKSLVTGSRRRDEHSEREVSEEGPKLAAWIEGSTVWVDMRSKMLYIIEGMHGKEAAVNVEPRPPPPPLHKSELVERSETSRAGARENEGEGLYHSRSILDVRMLSVSSSKDTILYGFLKTYVDEWKRTTAGEVVELIVNAATELGQFSRIIFDDFTDELIDKWIHEARAEEMARSTAETPALDKIKFGRTDEDAASSSSPSLGQQRFSPPSDACDGQASQNRSEVVESKTAVIAKATLQPSDTVIGVEVPRVGDAISLLKFECTAIALWTYADHSNIADQHDTPTAEKREVGIHHPTRGAFNCESDARQVLLRLRYNTRILTEMNRGSRVGGVSQGIYAPDIRATQHVIDRCIGVLCQAGRGPILNAIPTQDKCQWVPFRSWTKFYHQAKA